MIIQIVQWPTKFYFDWPLCPSNLFQLNCSLLCGIQPTDVVAKAMNVLHNICNMCTCDLNNMYAIVLPQHVTIHTCMLICYVHYFIILVYQINGSDTLSTVIDLEMAPTGNLSIRVCMLLFTVTLISIHYLKVRADTTLTEGQWSDEVTLPGK